MYSTFDQRGRTIRIRPFVGERGQGEPLSWDDSRLAGVRDEVMDLLTAVAGLSEMRVSDRGALIHAEFSTMGAADRGYSEFTGLVEQAFAKARS